MHDLVFLFDVDNTLLDNDRVTADLRRHLTGAFGGERAQWYWDTFEELRSELGYADYLGALQRFRVEHPRDPNLLGVSTYLVNYPFANRLYHLLAMPLLEKLPKGGQPKAKAALHEIYGAATKAEAEKAFDLFVKTYQAKYPKATECLEKDKGVLLAFYDFPAEHWVHIRTTNPIESVFSTVRLRHDKTKGSGSRSACLTMVFKLMESASKGWRSLNGSPLLAEVVRGTKFIDGIREKPAA